MGLASPAAASLYRTTRSPTPCPSRQSPTVGRDTYFVLWLLQHWPRWVGSLKGRGMGLQGPRRQRKTDPQRKPSGNHTSQHLHLLSTPDPIVNWKHKHLEGWKAHQCAALLGPWFYCRDTGPQGPPILQGPDQAPFMTHSPGPQGL